MIEFGKTLREAREAKGLTVAQLAEMTHMTASRVEELERENFAGIPAAIYGRGFVRLYCHAVGLDPKPLSDEFTEIFNGNRDTEIRERVPDPAPEASEPTSDRENLTRSHGGTETGPISDVPPPKMKALSRSHGTTDPKPATAAKPSAPTEQQGDLFDEPVQAPPPVQTSAPQRLRMSPSPAPALEEPTPAPERGPALSRYAAPLRNRPKISVPPAVWRFALLGCAALLVLWVLVVGIRALYRATDGAPAEDAAPSAEPAAVAPAEAPKAQTPDTKTEPARPSAAAESRTPQDIPALYID